MASFCLYSTKSPSPTYIQKSFFLLLIRHLLSITRNKMVVGEWDEKEIRDVVLTSPMSLEWESSDSGYRAPNILQRIFSLFKNVRPGSDLTRFQLPPLFNIPKSQLQCYGESVCCVNNDMLSKCADGETSLDRLICVIGWSISTFRPLSFGVAPYNPILGETHHVSHGTLHVLLEQVSHHPPVSALHATDENAKVELLWCQHPLSKFHGTTIETEVNGKRRLNLPGKGESYEMNSPKLLIRLFPVPSVDWVGNVKIKCQQSGLEADLCYRGHSLFSIGGSKRSIRGKIFDSSSSKTLYEVDGHWDRTVVIKDVSNGRVKVIYDAHETISGLGSLTVKDPQGVKRKESAAVWAEVSRGILSKDWEKAREAKNRIEEKEREMLRERKSRGENWIPKHFNLTHSKENGWDCSPKARFVPPAPIVYYSL